MPDISPPASADPTGFTPLNIRSTPAPSSLSPNELAIYQEWNVPPPGSPGGSVTSSVRTNYESSYTLQLPSSSPGGGPATVSTPPSSASPTGASLGSQIRSAIGNVSRYTSAQYQAATARSELLTSPTGSRSAIAAQESLARLGQSRSIPNESIGEGRGPGGGALQGVLIQLGSVLGASLGGFVGNQIAAGINSLNRGNSPTGGNGSPSFVAPSPGSSPGIGGGSPVGSSPGSAAPGNNSSSLAPGGFGSGFAAPGGFGSGAIAPGGNNPGGSASPGTGTPGTSAAGSGSGPGTPGGGSASPSGTATYQGPPPPFIGGQGDGVGYNITYSTSYDLYSETYSGGGYHWNFQGTQTATGTVALQGPISLFKIQNDQGIQVYIKHKNGNYRILNAPQQVSNNIGPAPSPNGQGVITNVTRTDNQQDNDGNPPPTDPPILLLNISPSTAGSGGPPPFAAPPTSAPAPPTSTITAGSSSGSSGSSSSTVTATRTVTINRTLISGSASPGGESGSSSPTTTATSTATSTTSSGSSSASPNNSSPLTFTLPALPIPGSTPIPLPLVAPALPGRTISTTYLGPSPDGGEDSEPPASNKPGVSGKNKLQTQKDPEGGGDTPTTPTDPNQFQCRYDNLGISAKVDAIGTALSFIQEVQLVGIDIKLGDQIPDGGISGFMKRFWDSLNLTRVLNILTFIGVVHNGYQLSNNLAQTMFGAFDNILQVFNVHLKDSEGKDIDTAQFVSTAIENLFISVFGVEQVHGIEETWKKWNRIYQSAANIVFSIQSISYSILNALETVGNYVAKIGNAAKKYGVFIENCYSWMNPNLNFTENRFFNGLRNAEEVVSNIDQVTSEVLSTQQSLQQIQEDAQKLTADVTTKETAKATTEATGKGHSLSPTIAPTDESKPAGS